MTIKYRYFKVAFNTASRGVQIWFMRLRKHKNCYRLFRLDLSSVLSFRIWNTTDWTIAGMRNDSRVLEFKELFGEKELNIEVFLHELVA